MARICCKTFKGPPIINGSFESEREGSGRYKKRIKGSESRDGIGFEPG